MAICTFCKHDMTGGESCTETHLHLRGEPFELPPYRRTRRLPLDRCGDCGVREGGYHHPGCDLQDCPRCGNQLLSCGCPWDEHAAEDPDEAPDDDPDLAPILAFERPEPPPPQPHEIPAFGPSVADLRAAHRDELRALASWAIAAGRSCDLDVAAAVLEAAQRDLTSDGFLLRRDTVTRIIMCDLRNLASFRRTVLPDGDMEAMWTTLRWCHATGRLSSASDPLPALLEPLQCYGMLGADGLPRPEGTDVDFVCQCFLPFDPTCPPGRAQRVIGRHPDTGDRLLITGRIRQRSEDPPVSCLDPLLAMARLSRQEDWVVHRPVDAFVYQGRIDPAYGVPELWMYDLRGSQDHHLFLDEDANAWTPKLDRRRRAGYRMVPLDGRSAVFRSGAFELVVAEERRREETVVELWDAR